MTAEEQKLCNGITFSVLKMAPDMVQEGRLEDAMYHAHVLLTPKRDLLVIKIWKGAPFNSLIQLEETDVDSFTVQVTPLNKNEDESYGYAYGGSRGHETYGAWHGQYAEEHFCMSFRSYSGLMIYPAVKCIIVDIIKDVNRMNQKKK